ncbi:MAG: response regulator [Minisyncoccia bacterium]
MAKKILLVEDEELIYSLLEKKLTQEGYEVKIARNGKEGLAILADYKPNLILLDIIMPEKDGFSVMETIKKDPALSKIPIIVISNSGQPVELNRAKELGAKDWLIKTDFDPVEILEKVKKYIE